MKTGEQKIDNPQSSNRPDFRISRLAVVSCILGILHLPCVIVLFTFVGRSLLRRSLHLPTAAFGCLIIGALAVLLGVIALACIATRSGRLAGRAFAIIGISIPIVALFLTVALRSLARPRSVAYHLYCDTNLSGIGKAMLIYGNDYDDEFPRAAGPRSTWGTTPNWRADSRNSRAEAFGLNKGPGTASISASLYLLVKYAEVEPKRFLCKGDIEATEFIPADYGVRNKEIVDLWDFGPDPSKHCSYTYHLPYGPHALTSASDPGLAVAADRNPWLPCRGAKPRNFKTFDPNGSAKAIKAGNTFCHQYDGQNVLFMDGHSQFRKSSACGLNEDNIYTTWLGSDIKKGSPPTMKSQPADANDSLLVHDPPRTDIK